MAMKRPSRKPRVVRKNPVGIDVLSPLDPAAPGPKKRQQAEGQWKEDRPKQLLLQSTGDVPQLVRLGEGEAVHIYDPTMPVWLDGVIVKQGSAICQSGKNAGRHDGKSEKSGAQPVVYKSSARFANCYRCMKLAKSNLARFGKLLQPSDGYKPRW